MWTSSQLNKVILTRVTCSWIFFSIFFLHPGTNLWSTKSWQSQIWWEIPQLLQKTWFFTPFSIIMYINTYNLQQIVLKQFRRILSWIVQTKENTVTNSRKKQCFFFNQIQTPDIFHLWGQCWLLRAFNGWFWPNSVITSCVLVIKDARLRWINNWTAFDLYNVNCVILYDMYVFIQCQRKYIERQKSGFSQGTSQLII